jgi:transcriptional regulator with XRE-family HTH domain
MARTTALPHVTKQFGARLREQRQARGWTLEQLAERVELHWTYVGSIERGERNVSLVNIVRLAKAVGVDPGELVRGLRS